MYRRTQRQDWILLFSDGFIGIKKRTLLLKQVMRNIYSKWQWRKPMFSKPEPRQIKITLLIILIAVFIGLIFIYNDSIVNLGIKIVYE